MKLLPIKLIALLVWLLFSTSGNASDFDVREYSLKAVFLERFTRFIDWPATDTPENQMEPFVVSVIGNPQFADLLREIYQTQKIQGKKVIVQEPDSISDVKNAHLLFISQDTKKELKKILEQARQSAVLTVSDSDGYAEQGVMINFFMSKKQKIRFEINELAIKESKLYISYKLLSVAKIVGGK